MAPKDLESESSRRPEASAPQRAITPPETAKRRPPLARRAAPWLLALILIVAGGWYGWTWWTTGRFAVSTDDAYVGADFAILAPKVSGYVANVAVRDNDVVRTGDPLIVLDDGDYRVRLRIAEATVASKEAAIARIDSQIGQARAAIGGATANVAAADAVLAQAEADLSRYENLAQSDFASRQRLEAARAAQATAHADLAARKAGVEEAEAALAVAVASRDEAVAALEGARAARDQAMRDLDAATIRAPFAGVVGNLAAATGDYVQPGARLLALMPLSDVYIDANFKETQLEPIAIGAPVTVEVDAYPDRSFIGHVVSFAPATGSVFSLLPPENATGNFTKVVQRLPVRIAVPAEVAKQGWLRPGLSVTVTADSRDAGRSDAPPAAAER